MQRSRKHWLDWRAVGLMAGLGLAFLSSEVLWGQDSPAAAPAPAAGTSAPQSSPAASQGATSPAAPDTKQSTEVNAAEVTTRDTAPTFKVRVNEVLVRVVVRDESGKIIPDLKKEDFQLLDNRKPQTISSFAVETPETRAVVPHAVTTESPEGGTPTVTPVPTLPQR